MPRQEPLRRCNAKISRTQKVQVKFNEGLDIFGKLRVDFDLVQRIARNAIREEDVRIVVEAILDTPIVAHLGHTVHGRRDKIDRIHLGEWLSGEVEILNN